MSQAVSKTLERYLIQEIFRVIDEWSPFFSPPQLSDAKMAVKRSLQKSFAVNCQIRKEKCNGIFQRY